jgi:hemerythrin
MSLKDGDLREGLATMDREHHEQLQLMQALQDVLEREPEGARTRQIFAQLQDYLKVHFLSEQLMMRLHTYPGYKVHVQEHDQVLDHLATLRDRIEAGNTDAVTALQGLQEELARHIRERDHELARFLQQPSGEAQAAEDEPPKG